MIRLAQPMGGASAPAPLPPDIPRMRLALPSSRPLAVLLPAAALLAAAAGDLAAQARPSGSLRPSLPPIQVVSLNPIGLAAGLYSAEYEVAVARQLTVAGAASYVDFGNDDITTVDGRVRIYANEALDGFAFGLSAGLGRSRREDAPGSGSWGVVIGSMLDYQWLLGPQRNFAVATGVGFKRFVTAEAQRENGANAWPTGRLSVGFAF